MNDQAKSRIVAAVDRLAARGVVATTLRMHPDTAREHAIHATRVDLGSESLMQSAEQIAAELSHHEHDPRGKHDPHGKREDGSPILHRPKSAADAEALARPRCQRALRRAVVLDVRLDAAAAPGALHVTGKQTVDHAEEA